MPAGRNQVDYIGIGYRAQTFKVDGSTIAYDSTKPNGIGKATGTGDAVTLSANDTVALTQDGDAVTGKLLKVEADGFCSVQVKGYAPLPAGASVTVTRGKKIVGALGASSARGYIREVATGTAAELGKQGGTIYNTADTTAVIVDLG